MSSERPLEESSLLPLKELLRTMDAEIHALYEEYGIPVGPRFSMALIRIADSGPSSIGTLAAYTGVSHSAMSQAVSALAEEGLVSVTTGLDRRHRMVHLTDAGDSVVPFLRAEWEATESAVQEIDASLDVSLLSAVEQFRRAIESEPFSERIKRAMLRNAK